MDENLNELEQVRDLTQNYLVNLKLFFRSESSSSLPSKPESISAQSMQQESLADLREYFENACNMMHYNEECRQEQKKQASVHVNEKVAEIAKKANKSFEVDWNLEFCEHCKLSYWPNNCSVYTLPKARITHATAKLYAKHKLADYKPRYKSYKEKLLKKSVCRGVRLIYECKRCKSRNVIIQEIKRAELKTIKLKRPIERVNLASKFVLNSLSAVNKQQPKQTTCALVSKTNSTAVKKKFLSLQLKLKQSEMEQERVRNEKEKTFGSLASFLEDLS